MSGESEATRRRILDAALDIAGAEGLEALTTRRVASQAGVNLGLLHYHFGSKDALAAEASQAFFADIRALAEGLDERLEPAAALERLLGGALEHAARRPGLLFSFLGRALAEASLKPHDQTPLEGPFLRFSGVMRLMVEKASAFLARGLGTGFDQLVPERTLRLFVSVLHPLLLTSLPGALLGFPLNRPEARAAYVAHAVADALRRPD